jgi:hypothetical protein
MIRPVGLDGAVGADPHPLAEPLMRTPRIEVGDVFVQHPLEVALVDNGQMIQTLGPR